jgi:hypothetical protein
MERNKYELQREVLARKYETILKDFEDTNDDRRIAWNCYQQIIGVCEAMRDSGMENNFVCCAVNKSIREQETEIDEIITQSTRRSHTASFGPRLMSCGRSSESTTSALMTTRMMKQA